MQSCFLFHDMKDFTGSAWALSQTQQFITKNCGFFNQPALTGIGFVTGSRYRLSSPWLTIIQLSREKQTDSLKNKNLDNISLSHRSWDSHWWLSGKERACQCRRYGFNPWVGKIPQEKEMVTHSSILAWEIPSTEEPGGLQSMGLAKSQTRLNN